MTVPPPPEAQAEAEHRDPLARRPASSHGAACGPGRPVVRWRAVHDVETLRVLAGIILGAVSPVDANDRPPTDPK